MQHAMGANGGFYDPLAPPMPHMGCGPHGGGRGHADPRPSKLREGRHHQLAGPPDQDLPASRNGDV